MQLGATALSHGLTRLSNGPTGGAGALGPISYNFFLQVHLPVAHGLFLSPELIYMPGTLLPNRSADGSTATSFLVIGLPLTANLGRRLDVSLGPALVGYEIRGAGGLQTLSEGGGPGTFASPGGTVTSRTMAAVMGASLSFGGGKIGLDAMAEAPFNDAKRTYSALLTVAVEIFQL